MKTFIFDCLSAAFFTCFLQNIIFTGGFGITETVRMAAKPSNLFKSGAFVTLFSVSVTLLSRWADGIPAIKDSGKIVHAIVFSVILALVYTAALITARLMKASALTQRRMSVCALNTLVLSLPYIVYSSSFSTAQAFGAALGASCAYVAATVLIHAGIHRIKQNESIPPSFSSNGALFIYTAILCLAFSGIAGERIVL